MRLLRNYIIILLLMAVSITANAQQVWLSGSVVDIDGKPLPNISVLAYKLDTRTILAYSSTNVDGKYGFGVSVSADSLDIGVNSLFFEKKRQRIANCTQTVNFMLREEVQELKGVTVKASPIEQHGDTLEYFVGSFVQKQDKSIEDVLKRMPGIEVEDNGKITYQGLPIQKFYVEGLDLMGKGYAQVSKNLPHQSVASVEVYENHQPIKLLEDRVSSEQASINIKLTNEVALTGTCKIALGAAPFLWNVNLTPMLFSAKMQFLASYKTNNTGDDVTQSLQYAELSQSVNHVQQLGEDLSIKAAATPLFNSRRYLNNLTHHINLNALTPINDKMQVRVNLYYLNDLQKQVAGQRSTLFLANDTINYSEDLNNCYLDNKVFGTITLNRNDKNVYLDDKLHFSCNWDKASGLVINEETPVYQVLNTPLANFSNDLRIVFPIGKHLIDFTSLIGHGQAPHSLSIESNQCNNRGRISQTLYSRQTYTDNAFSGIFTIQRFTIQPKMGFLFEQRNVSSQLRLVEGVNEWNLVADSDAKIVRNKMKPYFNMQVEYKRRRLTLSLDLPFSLPFTMVRNESGHNEKLARLFFDPSLYAKLKLGDFWTLNVSTQWQHEINNYDSWLDSYVLTDYQSLVLRDAPLSVSQTLSGSVSMQYKQPFISLNADARYGAGTTFSEMMYQYEVGEGGATQLKMFAQPNKRFYQNVSGNISKYFSSIRTTIGLKGLFFDTHGVALVNGTLLNMESVSLSLSPSVMLKVAEWLNMDYSLSYNQLFSFADGQQRSSISYWRHFANVYAFVNRDNMLSLTTEYYNHQGEPYLFMDFCYQYTLPKPKLDFELRWNNIFNSKQYVSYYSGAFSVQETVYQLRPMEITASVRFRF